MKNKFLVLIVVLLIATLGLSVFLTMQNPKTTTKLSMDNGTNNSRISQNGSVVAKLEGPESTREGSSIQLIWKVTNNLDVPITDVQGIDQNEFHNFGQIDPGETKTYSLSMEIPPLKVVKSDFGLNTACSDPIHISGFNVKYFVNGVEFDTSSNSFESNLV